MKFITRTVNSIKDGGLTQRALIFGCRVTDVVAELGTTNEANVSINLLRLLHTGVRFAWQETWKTYDASRVSEMLWHQRGSWEGALGDDQSYGKWERDDVGNGDGRHCIVIESGKKDEARAASKLIFKCLKRKPKSILPMIDIVNFES